MPSPPTLGEAVSSEPSIPSHSLKRKQLNSSAPFLWCLKPFSQETIRKYHELLAKAFIEGSKSFRLLDNPNFQKSQKLLASGRSITLLNRKSIVSRVIPTILQGYISEKEEYLSKNENFTLSVDGWKDVSGNIYACLLLVTKWCLKDNDCRIQEIISSNMALVNYFSESSYYAEVLKKWREENRFNHGLQTYSESRWYSFSKVFKSVEAHEEGFKHCKLLNDDANVNIPPLPPKILDILKDSGCYWTTNKDNSNIGDILPQFLIIVRQIDLVAVPLTLQNYKISVLSRIQKHAKKYLQPLYLVALFLCTKYRRIATSIKFSTWELKQVELGLFRLSLNQALPSTDNTMYLKEFALHIFHFVIIIEEWKVYVLQCVILKAKLEIEWAKVTIHLMLKFHQKRMERTQNSELDNTSELEMLEAFDNLLLEDECEEFEDGLNEGTRNDEENSETKDSRAVILQDALNEIFDFSFFAAKTKQFNIYIQGEKKKFSIGCFTNIINTEINSILSDFQNRNAID
ncbi:hypothetical protein HK099_006940 [Clydaea vesicula]|uniref:DUF659 domain-containing protein n=1 Tax=Clydaea vesicula TaxID=447962 RepID=A0AAD5U0M5_9FUNG|nr:hypothetical protein HK099_006940 [Clydaea vesicula]